MSRPDEAFEDSMPAKVPAVEVRILPLPAITRPKVMLNWRCVRWSDKNAITSTGSKKVKCIFTAARERGVALLLAASVNQPTMSVSNDPLGKSRASHSKRTAFRVAKRVD